MEARKAYFMVRSQVPAAARSVGEEIDILNRFVPENRGPEESPITATHGRHDKIAH